MIVARTVEEAHSHVGSLPRPLGLVPTMGALHRGHLSLVEAAKSRCASIAASLFVNPTQFAPGEDFHAYPRNEAHDFKLFEQAGVDVVFAPAPDEVYATDHSTIVHVGGPLTESYEAAERPSHFDGVATVVAKLLAIVQPDEAFFGQKDAQQLAVIRRMTRDLNLPVEIMAVPTVRESDGLAMSSRNTYLTPEQRAVAPNLYGALIAGAQVAGSGADVEDVIAAAAATLASLRPYPNNGAESLGRLADDTPCFAVDYIAVVNADTFVEERVAGPRSLLIAAARLGPTRLLDNIMLPSAYPARDATN